MPMNAFNNSSCFSFTVGCTQVREFGAEENGVGVQGSEFWLTVGI
jgi:hypothetical protein